MVQMSTCGNWKIESTWDLVDLAKEISKQNFNNVNLILSIVYDKI